MTGTLLALALLASPDARAVLEKQCRTEAADPKNPWALAHGLIAFGPTFRARDGRRAADVIVHDFARPDSAHPGRFAFPQFEDGAPVEPHPHLLVAALLDSGLPLTERFSIPDGGVTLGDLVRGVEESSEAAALARDWPSAAWTLEVLAQVESPRLATLEPLALTHLEEQQAFLGEAMDRGQSSVAKQHQGIWGEPCGGLHLVEAVMAGAREAKGRAPLAQRLERQQAIVFYRLGAEHEVYADALQRAAPELVIPVLAQELKFYGHWLEAVGQMKSDGVLIPTARQRAQITEGQAFLAAAVEALRRRGAFTQKKYRREQPQLALDLIGDACHAVNGLALTSSTR